MGANVRMQRTIFLTDPSLLRLCRPPYTRLYFGNEFCQRLLPSVSQLDKALSAARGRDLDFSLVTPYVTDEGMRGVKKLCVFLKKTGCPVEVIVNDWGVLQMVSRDFPSLTPVLGRLLTKQKRGPTVPRLLARCGALSWSRDASAPFTVRVFSVKKLPHPADHYYRGSNAASVPALQRFLIGLGVRRIELDNTLQGIETDLLPGMKASLYLPYVYITTTFYCPTAGSLSGQEDYRKIRPCARLCRRAVFTLSHSSMPVKIYLKGNTHFYKNTRMPERLDGVDRLVYEPALPV